MTEISSHLNLPSSHLHLPSSHLNLPSPHMQYTYPLRLNQPSPYLTPPYSFIEATFSQCSKNAFRNTTIYFSYWSLIRIFHLLRNQSRKMAIDCKRYLYIEIIYRCYQTICYSTRNFAISYRASSEQK